MTQKQLIDVAWAQLPKPDYFLGDTFNVDFNQKEDSCKILVGNDIMHDWHNYEWAPIRVTFKKVSGQWQIVEPLAGFDIEQFERENPMLQ